jgi:hypothetical protein
MPEKITSWECRKNDGLRHGSGAMTWLLRLAAKIDQQLINKGLRFFEKLTDPLSATQRFSFLQ